MPTNDGGGGLLTHDGMVKNESISTSVGMGVFHPSSVSPFRPATAATKEGLGEGSVYSKKWHPCTTALGSILKHLGVLRGAKPTIAILNSTFSV